MRGVCRAIDMEYIMNVHGRAWRKASHRHAKVEWILMIAHGYAGGYMEWGMVVHDCAWRMPGH